MLLREVETHEGDEGEDDWNRHGGHMTELRHACVDGRDVVGARGRGVILETETRLETAGKEPVMGYRRKISVHASVPQLGEPGRIFVNTRCLSLRGAKASVFFLRSFQNQRWSMASETLL